MAPVNRLFNAVKAVLVSVTKAQKHATTSFEVEKCIHSRKLMSEGDTAALLGKTAIKMATLVYQVPTGRWWKTLRVYWVAGDVSKKDLYLKLWGIGTGGTTSTYRVRLF